MGIRVYERREGIEISSDASGRGVVRIRIRCSSFRVGRQKIDTGHHPAESGPRTVTDRRLEISVKGLGEGRGRELDAGEGKSMLHGVTDTLSGTVGNTEAEDWLGHS